MLRVRWLGRVVYPDAHVIQVGLFDKVGQEWLLLLEHPHVYTLGVRADESHVLVDVASVGADLVRTDRGGDVTYHGPGQLVGYPILDVAMGPDAIPRHVHATEQVVIDTLADLGLTTAGRLEGFPGVWVDPEGPKPRKICAVGTRVSRGRSMHGFALNVSPDMAMFGHIVPCGLAGMAVTSLAEEGIAVDMPAVVEVVSARAQAMWSRGQAVERQDVAWRTSDSDLSAFARGAPEAVQPSLEGGGAPVTVPVRLEGRGTSEAVPVRLERRLAQAGVAPGVGVALAEPKPEWLRTKARMGPEFRSLRSTMRSLDLVTVCEEAGCPNIFECWADGTATFMINGERCTRACGFCLVDTRHPLLLAPDEPERVAEAVARLGLAHAVITAVARDDLADGGAGAFARVIEAVHARCPSTNVEVLIPDCKGDASSLEKIFASRPEVLNHNLETVARLQRAVRPSASYPRSLAVLARAKQAGLVTKSGIILGMGETEAEVLAALGDLAGVGVDIVTLGQYLRPTAHHLRVARWWRPEEFDGLRAQAMAMGFAHVEASPLTRSSYHARAGAEAAGQPWRPK
ncbi:MAG: lipoyl synthase [Acidimicrobiales bacterium]